MGKKRGEGGEKEEFAKNCKIRKKVDPSENLKCVTKEMVDAKKVRNF